MTKIITFSRHFLANHPRKKEPTFFVEKLLHSKGVDYKSSDYNLLVHSLNQSKIMSGKLSHKQIADFLNSLVPIEQIEAHLSKKITTIRSGSRFKAGELVQLAVWSASPYSSPQINFSLPLEIKKQYLFQISPEGNYAIDHMLYEYSDLKSVAHNDGLDIDDFELWFNLKRGQNFQGQVICFEDIDY